MGVRVNCVCLLFMYMYSHAYMYMYMHLLPYHHHTHTHTHNHTHTHTHSHQMRSTDSGVTKSGSTMARPDAINSNTVTTGSLEVTQCISLLLLLTFASVLHKLKEVIDFLLAWQVFYQRSSHSLDNCNYHFPHVYTVCYSLEPAF